VKIRRLLGAALTVPVLLGGLLLVTAGPAAACSCPALGSDSERAARAEAVFVGKVVGERVDPSVLTREYRQREKKRIEELKERFGRSAVPTIPDPVVLTFEVSRVYKGTVSERQEIVTPGGGGGGCGLSASGGKPLLVFAYQSSDDVFRLDPGQYGSSLCSGSRMLAHGGEPALGGPGGPSTTSLAVGVGVLAAVVAAGLGLAALKGRRRASAD
jgi:hypothetical protein